MIPLNSSFIILELGLAGAGFWSVYKNKHGVENWFTGIAALVILGHACSIALSSF